MPTFREPCCDPRFPKFALMLDGRHDTFAAELLATHDFLGGLLPCTISTSTGLARSGR